MPHPVSLDRPHPVYDTAATRRIEAAAQAALPPHVLMQRAGLVLARLGMALAPHARTVWLACGPGNNGGDGLEAAAHLQRWGLNPIVTWLGTPEKSPVDAHAAWQRARAAGVVFADAPPEDLGARDLAIDALLGIGATRAPAGAMAHWLQRLHAGPTPVLAVDVPTGLNADTGVLAHPVVGPFTAEDGLDLSARVLAERTAPLGASAPRHTLTLLTLKPGLFTADGRDACGQLWFDDLGVAPTHPPSAWLSGAPALAPRPHASHKGRWGDVAVVGGETDTARGTAMTGAALLAASAALHGGAGRVYVSPLGNAGPWLDPAQPELMFRSFDALALRELTVVCGCGGGDAVRAVLAPVLQSVPRLVLDADALNAIAADAGLQAALRQRHGRAQTTVLTPHPLEAARLLGCSAQAVQQDRLHAAQNLAERFQSIVVLKGSGTVIAAPGSTPHLNPTGNARLATAGTGDVLAGLIGARLAAGQPTFAAACDAVYRHGAVADDWCGNTALTAAELARRL